MKISIVNCFGTEGSVGIIARSEKTYQRTLLSLEEGAHENGAVAIIPTESEPEEDLGVIETEEERMEVSQLQAAET